MNLWKSSLKITQNFKNLKKTQQSEWKIDWKQKPFIYILEIEWKL